MMSDSEEMNENKINAMIDIKNIQDNVLITQLIKYNNNVHGVGYVLMTY